MHSYPLAVDRERSGEGGGEDDGSRERNVGEGYAGSEADSVWRIRGALPWTRDAALLVARRHWKQAREVHGSCSYLRGICYYGFSSLIFQVLASCRVHGPIEVLKYDILVLLLVCGPGYL